MDSFPSSHFISSPSFDELVAAAVAFNRLATRHCVPYNFIGPFVGFIKDGPISSYVLQVLLESEIYNNVDHALYRDLIDSKRQPPNTEIRFWIHAADKCIIPLEFHGLGKDGYPKDFVPPRDSPLMDCRDFSESSPTFQHHSLDSTKIVFPTLLPQFMLRNMIDRLPTIADPGRFKNHSEIINSLLHCTRVQSPYFIFDPSSRQSIKVILKRFPLAAPTWPEGWAGIGIDMEFNSINTDINTNNILSQVSRRDDHRPFLIFPDLKINYQSELEDVSQTRETTKLSVTAFLDHLVYTRIQNPICSDSIIKAIFQWHAVAKELNLFPYAFTGQTGAFLHGYKTGTLTHLEIYLSTRGTEMLRRAERLRLGYVKKYLHITCYNEHIVITDRESRKGVEVVMHFAGKGNYPENIPVMSVKVDSPHADNVVLVPVIPPADICRLDSRELKAMEQSLSSDIESCRESRRNRDYILSLSHRLEFMRQLLRLSREGRQNKFIVTTVKIHKNGSVVTKGIKRSL